MTVAGHMSIFDQEPTDWVELESRVAQLFAELGCEVEINARLKLVRGSKKVDVWVRDAHVTPVSQYLCECKFWKKPVPQDVIHSFMTVVSQYGAHRGFIISLAGFQAGARRAVRKTNVDLVTFAELQTIFFDRWRIAMGKRFMPYADRLFPYWDYPGKMPKIKWGNEQLKRLRVLIEAYLPLVHLGPHLESQGFAWDLPMTLPALDSQGDVSSKITLSSYRQLYDFIDRNKDVALRHFRMLYGEVDT